MGDGYMCGRNVKMKESLSHFCGISFLPKWDFFFCGLQNAVLEYHHVGNGEYADNRYEKARVIREQSSYISYSMNRYQVHPYLLYKGIRHHTPCESEGAFL